MNRRKLRITLADALLAMTLFIGAAIAIISLAVVSAPSAHATTTGYSDYLENKTTDWLMRGTAFTPPATGYIGLTTETCSDSANGTEPSSGAYARVSVAANTTNWAGTQSAGSTTASSGTGGTTSNNGAITFPTSTGAWASSANLQAVRYYDASTAGNMLWCIDLTSPIAVTASGFTLSFSAGSLQLTIN